MAPLSTLAVAALAAVAAALPNTKPTTTKKSPQPTCKRVVRNANFDDLAGIPGLEFNPIPTPYMGLYYQGFDYTTVVRTGLGTGVLPHSGNNYAGSNFVTQLDGTPMFTVYYPSSTIKSFDLSSFYFGCALNLGQGAAAVPNACNIQFTGYKGSDNSVANAKQQQAFSGKVKSCFTGLQFVIVTFTPPGGQSALAADLALVLDDIKYTTYTCKK